jgi:hypothetical protein
MEIKNPQQEYNNMRQHFLKGHITEGEWMDFCVACLVHIMDQPEIKEVFIRLKDR